MEIMIDTDIGRLHFVDVEVGGEQYSEITQQIGRAVLLELDDGDCLDLENITCEVDSDYGMFIRIWVKELKEPERK